MEWYKQQWQCLQTSLSIQSEKHEIERVRSVKTSDILLGDHLHEKSATVQWIGADMPHKRKNVK